MADRIPTTDMRPVREWLSRHMAELIVYGGLIATRQEAFDDALERTGSIQGASVFAFSSTVRVATPEQAAALPSWPTCNALSGTRVRPSAEHPRKSRRISELGKPQAVDRPRLQAPRPLWKTTDPPNGPPHVWQVSAIEIGVARPANRAMPRAKGRVVDELSQQQSRGPSTAAGDRLGKADPDRGEGLRPKPRKGQGRTMPPISTLFYGDNLDVLRKHILSSTVDLVYLDPPFNSKAAYNQLFQRHDGTKAAAQVQAFKDTWTWDAEAAANFADAVSSGGRVAKAMMAFQVLFPESDMLAYLSMMAPRLVELHRVLKPTGSIYLHCDPTASHYLKLLLDAVFGPERFRSEVIWKRTTAHSSAKRWAPVHDTIFYYGKGSPFWSEPRVAYDQGYLDKYYRFDDGDGRRYWRADITGAGTRNGSTGTPWRGYDPNDIGRHWTTTPAKLELLARAGAIYFPPGGGMPMKKRYRDQLKGVAVSDVWDDIDRINPVGSERVGYPTQKPVAMLERILSASSNPGDVVLDPFCGCGTTIAAAEKMGRQWLGIDITHLAIAVIKNRLATAFTGGNTPNYSVRGEPVDMDGARQLAADNKYQFQYWALGLVGARPDPGQEKKGADHGIDGVMHLIEPDGTVRPVVISVKGGHVTVSQVRDLVGVVEREKAAAGLFISIEEPTDPMRREAASAGHYQAKAVTATSHPKIQLLTIEGLLSGTERPDLPAGAMLPTLKASPPVKQRPHAQAEMF